MLSLIDDIAFCCWIKTRGSTFTLKGSTAAILTLQPYQQVETPYHVRVKTYHLDRRGQGERGFPDFCTDAVIISN
ncbi:MULTISPECIES: hypothetical protein [unclassified Nostoc]|uniref:hypothetical protein n=1 Tax=unclassified Nostoc TaxID=2593658 RepID=UPI001D268D37|nr:hypothetical protein [Nostoc sp. JL34]MBN3882427.1 hypothetical protein [Nostoc sp. JL34]